MSFGLWKLRLWKLRKSHGNSMKILLGITGSVAATLAPKILQAMQEIGEVKVVVTESSKHFFDVASLQKQAEAHRLDTSGCPSLLDGKSEWDHWHKKGDPVDHIDLVKWADVLVVAPLTANTMAKIAHGLCDNLLTCLIRAWDPAKPMVLAPAMNTRMLNNPLCNDHLTRIRMCFVTHVVETQKKVLACGDVGDGAMGEIAVIKDKVLYAICRSYPWFFPLEDCNGIPINGHPGSFGYIRRHDIHTGVDLYTKNQTPVRAVEDGEVLRSIPFTGSKLGHTWWLDTEALLVRGRSGVVCYGEITPLVQTGLVKRGQVIGFVKQVLPDDGLRQGVPGHSCSMLHLELYSDLYLPEETTDDLDRGIWRGWDHGEPKPSRLLDPTSYLLGAESDRIQMPLTMEKNDEVD